MNKKTRQPLWKEQEKEWETEKKRQEDEEQKLEKLEKEQQAIRKKEKEEEETREEERLRNRTPHQKLQDNFFWQFYINEELAIDENSLSDEIELLKKEELIMKKHIEKFLSFADSYITCYPEEYAETLLEEANVDVGCYFYSLTEFLNLLHDQEVNHE